MGVTNMQVKEITARVKRLVAGPIGGLDKFENVTFECEVVVLLDHEANPHEAYDQAMKFCKSKVNQELDRLEGKVVQAPLDEDYIPSDGFKNQGKL